MEGEVAPVSVLLDELERALEGVPVTFDPGRSAAEPCIGCGAGGPHVLARVGVRTDGRALTMGRFVERPVCQACLAGIQWGAA